MELEPNDNLNNIDDIDLMIEGKHCPVCCEDKTFIYYTTMLYKTHKAYDLYTCETCHDALAFNLSDEWRDFAKMKTRKTHQFYLDELCKTDALKAISETPNYITLILREPVYYKEHCTILNKCPDLLIKYEDGSWESLELKGTYAKKENALKQIESGIEIITNELFVPKEMVSGKLVVYSSSNGYSYINTHVNGMRLQGGENT